MKISTLLLSFCAFFLSITTHAQKLPATFLWRIDGNGLQRPSYLYGTIHLTDERIFNLGDSLFAAIEHSEGFATELDPETFTGIVIDEAEKMVYNSTKMDNVFSDEKVKKYRKALAKKLGKKEENITTSDILREKKKWLTDGFDSNKMETFLDAYLYDAASRLGKWTGGIEDVTDQTGIMDDLVDESDIVELSLDKNDKTTGGSETHIGYEELIQMYINQDLNGILKFSESEDSLKHERMLTIRNRKMARRMDSLSNQRSMVFAVGAAHLPGADGLIELLRQKGYTLTPVFSSQKIKASSYKLPKRETKWFDVTDKDSNYTVLMPGKAESLTFWGTMDMRLFYDVFHGTVYMTTAMRLPNSTKNADSIFNYLSDYYFHQKKYKKGNPITLNNIEGRAFEDTLSSKYSSGYMLYGSNMIYLAIAVAEKNTTGNVQNIGKFLQSFNILKRDLSKDANSIYEFVDSAVAYSLSLPQKPTLLTNIPGLNAEKSAKSELYSSADLANGTYYIFGSSMATPGFYIDDDAATVSQLKYNIEQRLEKVDVDTDYVYKGQHVVELKGTAKKSEFLSKCKYMYRSNRWYSLAVVNSEKDTNSDMGAFFNSFKMLHYPETKWKYTSAPDSIFTTWTPGAVVRSDEDDTLDKQYLAFDTARSTTYSIREEHFSKYYWQPNDSTLLEDIGSWSTENRYIDSLISKKLVQNNGIKGIETIVERGGSSNYRRTRYLVNNNKLYVLYTLLPKDEINSDNVNRFFENFKLRKAMPSNELFISKSKQLMADLNSNDSIQKKKAHNNLRSALFVKSDLPLLQETLLNIHDNETGYTSIREGLINAILKVHDSASFYLARDKYPAAADTNRNSLLSIMMGFPSEEHYREVAGLLNKYPPNIEPGYRFARQLLDSLSLTAKVIEDFMPLLKVDATQGSILSVTRQLADKGMLRAETMKPYNDIIISATQKVLDNVKADSSNMDYVKTYSLVPLLSWMNTDKSNEMLLQFSNLSGYENFRLKAVDGLIRNGQTISLNTLKALATNRSTRLDLYDTLVHYNKSNLFPAKYKSQLYMAESYVYYAASDDEEPEKIEFIEKKEFEYKGKKALFFFYKVRYAEDEEDIKIHLGCAGPFDLDKQVLHNAETLGDIYFKEPYKPELLSQQQNELLNQMQAREGDSESEQ